MPRVSEGSKFANPFLACAGCGKQVTHRDDVNRPCGHKASFESVCPSWSPVDGCRCQEHLGHVSHGRPE